MPLLVLVGVDQPTAAKAHPCWGWFAIVARFLVPGGACLLVAVARKTNCALLAVVCLGQVAHGVPMGLGWKWLALLVGPCPRAVLRGRERALVDKVHWGDGIPTTGNWFACRQRRFADRALGNAVGLECSGKWRGPVARCCCTGGRPTLAPMFQTCGDGLGPMTCCGRGVPAKMSLVLAGWGPRGESGGNIVAWCGRVLVGFALCGSWCRWVATFGVFPLRGVGNGPGIVDPKPRPRVAGMLDKVAAGVRRPCVLHIPCGMGDDSAASGNGTSARMQFGGWLSNIWGTPLRDMRRLEVAGWRVACGAVLLGLGEVACQTLLRWPRLGWQRLAGWCLPSRRSTAEAMSSQWPRAAWTWEWQTRQTRQGRRKQGRGRATRPIFILVRLQMCTIHLYLLNLRRGLNFVVGFPVPTFFFFPRPFVFFFCFFFFFYLGPR